MFLVCDNTVNTALYQSYKSILQSTPRGQDLKQNTALRVLLVVILLCDSWIILYTFNLALDCLLILNKYTPDMILITMGGLTTHCLYSRVLFGGEHAL